MAGITDTVFRRFIRNLGGCGLMMTEFTSADGIIRHKDKKAKRYLTFYGDEHPISAQLFGSDPATLSEAARIVAGPRLRPRRSQPRLPRAQSRHLQRRLRPAAQPAAHPEHLRVGPRRREDSLHREIPRRMERQGSRPRATGEDGRRLRTRRRRPPRPHSRAGLQRTGALGVDRRPQRRGQDSRHRQRRHPLARRRRRHGRRDRMRRRHDRPHRRLQSLDLPPDRAVHRAPAATTRRPKPTATR